MILHGRNILLLQDGAAIAAAKSCDLSVQCETIPVASPSTGAWATSIPGRKSWAASCSHLVTSITDPLAMIGTEVTMRLQLADKMGLSIGGFTPATYTVEQQSAISVDAVLWDRTNKSFIGVKYQVFQADKYYINWTGKETYTEAAAGTYFYDTSDLNKVYKRTATDLVPEALQGTAIVKEWKCSAAVGTLAAGQFNFEGKGALAIPTT